MQLKKPSLDEHESLVENYKSRTIEQLKKIIPKWAYGDNINNLFDYSQHPKYGDYKILLVSTEDLIKKVEFYDFNPYLLFTGDIASDSRVATTLFQWENEGYVDPPTISLDSDEEGKLKISDGRHRTKLTFHLGDKLMPIAVHNSSIQEVSKIIAVEGLTKLAKKIIIHNHSIIQS